VGSFLVRQALRFACPQARPTPARQTSGGKCRDEKGHFAEARTATCPHHGLRQYRGNRMSAILRLFSPRLFGALAPRGRSRLFAKLAQKADLPAAPKGPRSAMHPGKLIAGSQTPSGNISKDRRGIRQQGWSAVFRCELQYQLLIG